MEKELFFLSESDWNEWVTQRGFYSGMDFDDKPESYPCYILWVARDVHGSSHDFGAHGFVYPKDFENVI